MPRENSSLSAGAVMADASLNRRQTIRVGAGVVFAQVGIVGFDGQIELEALRLLGLPEAAPAVLYACPSVPIGTRSLALETTWDLPSLMAGATANIDVTVPPPQAYFQPIDWHRTALHKLGHWTGHASRLGREIANSFGSKMYAQKGLVAEMTAAFTFAALGIVPTVRHAD